MNDEEYWNSTDQVGFDFSDKDNWASAFESTQDFVGLKKFHSTGIQDCLEKRGVETKHEAPSEKIPSEPRLPGVRKSTDLPRTSLSISQEVESNVLKPTPRQTVSNMVLGLNYTLEPYKGINEKIALLESALKVHDGNVITAIVLFLKDTLKKSVFLQQILHHPKAVKHYLNYLSMDHEYDELFSTLLMIGNIEDAAILKYKLSLDTNDPEGKFRTLEKCLSCHFGQASPLLVDNLSQYIALLQWQLPIEKDDERQILEGTSDIFKLHPKRHSLIDVSVISTLFYCCIYHYNLSDNNLASPVAIRKRFHLSDKQFVWTAMSALCQLQKWPEVENLFLNKGWLGKTKLSCCIGFNKAVSLLANANAPSKVMIKYIDLVDSVEEKLRLAKKHKFHQFAMKILTAMRDKEQFLIYRAELSPKSVEYFEVQEALLSSSIKWKN